MGEGRGRPVADSVTITLMRRFAAVTTCHAAGYEAYGRRMIESFTRHWPEDVPLLVYHEGFTPEQAVGQVIPRDLLASSPELADFKRRHAENPAAHGARRPRRSLKLFGGRVRLPLPLRKAAYRWQAVRFAHKTFCIFHAARNTAADVLIWVDADTHFFADVSLEELESFIPEDSFVGCLKRRNHTECGFVAYNLRHPATAAFLQDFESFYTQDRLFQEREYHDSYLFDVARLRAEQGGAHSYDIGEGIGLQASHVLINSRLGRFMDHMKGDSRKEAGSSRSSDLLVPRDEAYWAARR